MPKTQFVLPIFLYGCFLAFPSTILASRKYVGHSVQMGAKWFEGVVFALGFTSTLLHYYYDGFIWKIRHKENQQFLGILPTESQAPVQSWWEGTSRSTALGAFVRQCLYFVPPILLLSVTFWIFKEDSIRSKPIGHAVTASSLAAAEASISAMEGQLEVESAMIQIRPRAKHFTYQADLLYMTGLAKAWVAEERGATGEGLREERLQSLADAVASMERALELGPPYGHPEDAEMSPDDIEERLIEWRLEMQEI